MDGAAASDTYFGGAGNDVLGGTYGSVDWSSWDGAYLWNTYEGGAGNDTLRGTIGGDTYRFGLGDGQDVIGECHWIGRISGGTDSPGRPG